jgi:hypothetical protein
MNKRKILNEAGKKVGEFYKRQPRHRYNKDGNKTPTGRVYPNHYHIPVKSKTCYIP